VSDYSNWEEITNEKYQLLDNFVKNNNGKDKKEYLMLVTESDICIQKKIEQIEKESKAERDKEEEKRKEYLLRVEKEKKQRLIKNKEKKKAKILKQLEELEKL
jgi:hypothetical protein